MSRARPFRRQQMQADRAKAKVTAKTALAAESRILRAPLWLTAAFVMPNLGALACGFVLDDRVLIVENDSLHVQSLRQLADIWKSGYWPNNHGIDLYRPVTQTVWALIWAAGGGKHPALFHAFGLALGLAVVLLLYYLLLLVRTAPRTAFIAALLFALLPIHTEATTSVTGSAEVIAAAFSLCALICYYRSKPVWAVVFFVFAVFSKESAAAAAALPLVFSGERVRARDSRLAGGGAAVVITVALVLHDTLLRSSEIPFIDNPAAFLNPGRRILTALWVQCLYLSKAVVPIRLSADYSFRQIHLVTGLADWRGWAGLALAAGGLLLALRRPRFRAPVLAYAILFSPTANILFPIGTTMGERLVYAPSLGLALLLSILLSRSRHWKVVLVAVALVFAARTAVRNLDWLNVERFYAKLVETSPNSANAHYSIGVLRSAKGDDVGAVEAYDRAIAIFPAFAVAYRNRGNALARLGRREEAMASYRQCLQLDPKTSPLRIR